MENNVYNVFIGRKVKRRKKARGTKHIVVMQGAY